MTTPHAYNEIALGYDGNIVFLRPSLRAATTLERMHGGFAPLLQKVQQGHTATLRGIVLNSGTDRTAAQTLLRALKGATLRDAQEALIAPAFSLLTALMTPDTDQGEAAKATPSGKQVAWADLYADAYKIATGWLGWTPETAWLATLPEIMNAFDGHVEKLKAIHGTTDDDQTTATAERTADQRQANINAGLDPEFDREGLRALKAKFQ